MTAALVPNNNNNNNNDIYLNVSMASNLGCSYSFHYLCLLMSK